MREQILRFMQECTAAKQQVFANNPFGIFVRTEIPTALYKTELVDQEQYLITASVGAGNSAMIPWICIFDRSITTTATKGVYIVYLLSRDSKRLYLTFNQGCTEIRSQHSKRETIRIMHQKAEEIRGTVSAHGFVPACDIDLGDHLTELGDMYREGTIFYKRYDVENVPGEQTLQDDLSRMMEVYREYSRVLQGDNRIGDFDSWTIVDEQTAIKHCDKSFFDYNGSGVPKGICWFFNAEQLDLGQVIHLKLLYQNQEFNGLIRNESSDRRRVRIFWNAELGRLLLPYRSMKNSTATFKRKGENIYELTMSGEQPPEFHESDETGDETEMKISEKINQIKNYISGKGFSYPDGLIENFYLSLKSKPFVILAGTSGTGKTRLVRLFAEAIGANDQNGQYKQVAVRPDWSDSTDLFGHVDLNGNFIPGAILEFLAEAQRNPDHPYILCLDEMNLARVEYYLSDFLSVIETRDFRNGRIVTDPLVRLQQYGTDQKAKDKYGEIFFPENLYVVGTVNMDETTFPFSRKVLDRANTIEFNYVDLVPTFAGTVSATQLSEKNAFLKTETLKLSEIPEVDNDFIAELCVKLEKINKILQKANAHVGYRVRDEICFYMLNHRNANLLTDDAALDNEIMQKILPRIQGSGLSVKTMLCELFKKVLAKQDYDNAEGDAAGMEKLLAEGQDIPYPNSANKVMFMVRRFEEDGFTSYWL